MERQTVADAHDNAAILEGAGMIAMGTHGRGAVARAFMRSIADEILEHSTIPLCVIRRPKIGKALASTGPQV